MDVNATIHEVNGVIDYTFTPVTHHGTILIPLGISLSRMSRVPVLPYPMKAIGPDKTYIDYFQGGSASIQTSRFGVRIEQTRCFALVQIGDQRPFTFGAPGPIPIPKKLSALPAHILTVVSDLLLNDQHSDLAEVLTGKKSFQKALASTTEIEPESQASRA